LHRYPRSLLLISIVSTSEFVNKAVDLAVQKVRGQKYCVW
jgi:hypothetical protein